MQPSDQAVFDLLATRYLSGEASERECDRLFEMTESKAGHNRFARMQRHWDAAKPPRLAGFDVERAAAQIAAQCVVRRNPAARKLGR